MLSIMKEDSFLCRDARIRTRDLEYRNQTWSVSVLYLYRPVEELTGRDYSSRSLSISSYRPEGTGKAG